MTVFTTRRRCANEQHFFLFYEALRLAREKRLLLILPSLYGSVVESATDPTPP
jgi:hypothetical protein